MISTAVNAELVATPLLLGILASISAIYWLYLSYKNWECSEKLIDKLAEEYREDIDGNEMIYNANLN